MRIIVVAALLLGSSAALAEDFDHEPALYWWRGGFSPDFQTNDVIEWVVASRVGHSAFVYEYPMFVVYSEIGRRYPGGEQTDSTYNFRAVACFISTLADRSLDGRPFLSGKAEPRWWTYLLYAHNNSYKLRLSRGLRLTLTTRTDIAATDFEREKGGVLFTPRLGFEWVGLSTGFQSENPPTTNRLHLGVGHGYWWGFDGQNRSAGWTLVVGFAFLAAI